MDGSAVHAIANQKSQQFIKSIIGDNGFRDI